MIMRTIYIATYSCSTGKIQVVTEFAGQYSFQIYVDNEAGAFKTVPKRASIDNLCELLYDKGPGSGMRYHRRISYSEAKKHGTRLSDKYFR